MPTTQEKARQIDIVVVARRSSLSSHENLFYEKITLLYADYFPKEMALCLMKCAL